MNTRNVAHLTVNVTLYCLVAMVLLRIAHANVEEGEVIPTNRMDAQRHFEVDESLRPEDVGQIGRRQTPPGFSFFYLVPYRKLFQMAEINKRYMKRSVNSQDDQRVVNEVGKRLFVARVGKRSSFYAARVGKHFTDE